MTFTLHARQAQVFQSTARQILFGGSAGPGKSYLLRVAAIGWATAIAGLQIYLFRREFPELYRNHMEGPTAFPAMLEAWISAGRVKINRSTHEIAFANKSKIFLMHMQYDKDVSKIYGAEIHVGMVDELTQFTKAQYAFIRSRLRMTGITVPEVLHGQFPRIVCASNPTGIGHNWVKALFVDPAPPGKIWVAPPAEGGMTTQFIPARLQDNPTLLDADPGYVERLRGLNNPMLVRAMLEGDWTVTSGGMLDDLWNPDVHVIDPFPIPTSWLVFRAFDWGSTRPFSVGWWAKSDGTTAPNGRIYPRGTLIRINEWYGWNGIPNEGVKMLATEIAQGILEREIDCSYVVCPGPADPSIYVEENGSCIARDMAQVVLKDRRYAQRRCTFHPADTRPGTRKVGWEVVRTMLKSSTRQPMEDAGLFVFNTCRQFIRTVPVLPRDPSKPEDVDSAAEDHIGDEARYMCTWRPPTVSTVSLSGV